jgi:hypothetical protein
MPGFVLSIHVLIPGEKDVDGRDKPGHDDVEASGFTWADSICDRPETTGLTT